MIVVLVEHFLNGEGRRQFPAWLRDVAEAAGRYPGYSSLRRLNDPDEPTSCRMLLEFADGETLAAWVASSERAELLTVQEPYRLQPLHSRRFIAESA